MRNKAALTWVEPGVHQGEFHAYDLELATGGDLGRVIFDRMADEKGGIWCEVSVELADGQVVIPPSRTNVMNATRSGWRTHTDVLEERYPSLEWYGTFRSLVADVIAQHRNGDQPVLLDPNVDPSLFDKFLLDPLIAGRGVTVMYGEGGMGKSLLGLAAAFSVASGWPVFGQVPTKVGPVVYFDYEDDSLLHDIRLNALMRGFKYDQLPNPIYHKSLVAKVSSAQAGMRRTIAETGAVLAVLDSIGMGRGGDAHGPEDTIRMFRALRSLGVPVLALDHVSHETRRRKGTSRLEDLAPYGSVYTVNSARLLWGGLVAASSTPNERRIQLINTKANHVPRQDPFGVTIEYLPHNEIRLRALNQVWEEFDMTKWERIYAYLVMRDEFVSVKEISEECDISRDTVRKELSRHEEELEQMHAGREKRVRLRRER